jgi:ribosomal protein S18 acetylase RimI-like enzyme
MSADLKVRRLAPNEFAMFRSIRLESLALEPNAFASSHAQWTDLSDSQWRRQLTGPVFVACANGVAIGMMALRLNRPVKMTHRAVLTGVYVRAAFRGAGIADALLSEVISYACEGGIRQIELGVRADNVAAIRFYANHGFEQFGRIPDGFQDESHRVDEVLLILRFGQEQC